MNILFLDDDTARVSVFLELANGEHDVFVATTAEAAIRWLQGGLRFDIAFLDHDLEDQHYRDWLLGVSKESYQPHERTGLEVARHVCQMPEGLRPKLVVCHSFNPPARERMVQELRTAGVAVLDAPFGPGMWANAVHAMEGR